MYIYKCTEIKMYHTTHTHIKNFCHVLHLIIFKLCFINFSSKDKKEEKAINYFPFFALVTRQSTALGFVTQHAMSRKLGVEMENGVSTNYIS